MATINKSLTARFAASLGATAIATLAILGGGLPASAAEPQDIDPTKPVDLTVHVFEQPAAASGDSHSGGELDPTRIQELDGIEGVVFTATRVPTDAGDALIDLSTVAGWQQVTGLTAAAAESRIQDYQGTIAPLTATTDVHGTADFSGMVRGLYLVEQTANGSNQIAAQTAPFLVTLPLANANSWIYDVHVYPKNSTTTVDKTLVSDEAFVGGDAVDWTIRATIPQLAPRASLQTLNIIDPLDPRLTWASTTVTTSVPALELVQEQDYRVVSAGSTITVEFTLAGLARLSVGDDVFVTHSTTVNPLADTANGVIENTATVEFNGTPVRSNTEGTEWGSLSILKFAENSADLNDTSARLAGATFTIYPTADDASADRNAITTVTSNGDGLAAIDAFKAGTYWIVETQAPRGYTPHTGAIEVEVITGDFDTTATFQAQVANKQVPAYALPITGGSGQAAFMIGGAGLILGALGFVLLRRRKAQAANRA